MTMQAPAIEGVAVAWENRRELFSLDPRTVHLNHGSFGAVPIPVQRAQQRLRDETEANPVAFFTRGLRERIGHVRGHLAAFVNADPAGVALIVNATAAATAVLRSVALGTGDEILVTDHGYGALRLSAEEVAGRAGATVRVAHVPLAADDDEVLTRVLDAVRPGRTRLAIVDQIASPTAKLFPVGRLVAALQDRNVLVLVDAAHAPGMLDPYVGAADFWLGNLHKWAFAPRGTALLAVAPQHRARMRPLVVSWEQVAGFPLAQEFAGTLDYTPWLAAPTGLHLLRTLGLDRVRSHNNALARQGQRAVADAIGADCPAGSDAVSMRVVPLPRGIAGDPDAAAVLRNRLATEHRIEVPVTSWNGSGLLRISAQIYNQIDDYEHLCRALRLLTR